MYSYIKYVIYKHIICTLSHIVNNNNIIFPSYRPCETHRTFYRVTDNLTRGYKIQKRKLYIGTLQRALKSYRQRLEDHRRERRERKKR